MDTYVVYIMASERNGTLYIGVTNNLERRVLEHKCGSFDGFTKKYHVHHLVYYEIYGSITDAIHREKVMKEWRRDWKLKTIEKVNPQWIDLFADIDAPGSRHAPG